MVSKMYWNCFELKFQAKSPIYIGYGTQIGIVNRTRYYLLGKTIWGAVTAILSRNIMERYNAKIYEKVGECVKNNLIFSYFYHIRNKKEVLYPNYTDEGLKYGNLTSRDFEKEFISSYVSTAIDISSRTADEGSLHEFEFISPKVNKEEVCFKGYLFAKNGIIQKFCDKYLKILEDGIFIEGNNQNTSLFDLIKNLQIGGERNYGFGWLEIIKLKPINDNDEIFKKYKVNLKTKYHPEIKTKNGNEIIALSHVNIDNIENRIEYIKGDIEPLVGREWNEKGAGQKPEFSCVALVPGTKFRLKDDVKIKIGDYGIWKIFIG